MLKKLNSHRKPVHKTIVRRVVVVARPAKRSAKAVLKSEPAQARTILIVPNRLEDPVLRPLRRERHRLMEELKHQETISQDHPTTGNHMADDASDVAEQAKSLALRRHLEGMLREVDRAIARAEKGAYGKCERCGRPISEERLKVMPSATLCIEDARMQMPRLKLAA